MLVKTLAPSRTPTPWMYSMGKRRIFKHFFAWVYLIQLYRIIFFITNRVYIFRAAFLVIFVALISQL